jgi:HK97 family phage major capsid protein
MQSVREIRAEQQAIAAQMAVLARGNMNVEQKAVFQVLSDAAERRKRDIARAEGREIDGSEKEARAFGNYLRHGWNNLTEEDRHLLRGERRDMQTGYEAAYPGTTFGFFVPVEFSGKVESALKFHSDLWQTSTILHTEKGAIYTYPVDNDASISGELLDAEGTQVTETDIAGLSSVQLDARTFSSRMVKCSNELMQDVGFDLEAYLSEQFAIRLARATSPYFTSTVAPPPIGPTGIMNDAYSSGQTVIGDDNLTTPNPQTQIGYLDLVGLEMSVDAAYRRKGSWLMASSTLQFLKTLKDKNGRPMFPSLADRSPDDAAKQPSGILNGYPVRLSESMPTLAAGNSPLLFGDLSKFLIRVAGGMRVLRLSERFADYGQTAFVAFLRVDAALLDAGTHPVKFLTMHA